jgi:tetratricopeptide (TPR) repeat protein
MSPQVLLRRRLLPVVSTLLLFLVGAAGGCARVTLEDDVDLVLERALDGRVDRSTVRRLFDRSAGNPLLLRELVRAALADGSLVEGERAWHWSEVAGSTTSISDLAVRHLDELDDAASALFDCLALVSECTVAEAEALSEPSVLGDLVRTRIAIVDDHDGRVRPAHPLYAEAALARMTIGTRHERLRSLLAVVRPSPARPLDELRSIKWRREVHDPMAPDELVAATTLALTKYDVPLAIELGRAALEVGQDTVALTLALALIYAGFLDDAAAVLERAVAIAETEGDRVFAAVTRTLNRAYRTGFDPSIAEEYASLQATLTEPPLITMVRSERTSALAFAGRLHEAVALGAPYVLEGEAAPWDALAYLPGWAISASTLGRTDEVFHAVDALEHAAEPRAGRHVAWFHFVRAQAALLHGDLDRAQAAMARFAEEAHLAMVPGVVAELLTEKLGIIALWQGDIVTSQRLLAEAVVLCDVPESNFRRVFPLSYLAMAHALAGDATRARAAADEAGTWVRWLPLGEGYAIAADAWARAAAGDLTGASRIAMAGADRCEDLGLGSPALWCAADALRFSPSPAIARRVVALAETVDGRWSAAFSATGRAWLAKDPRQMSAAVDRYLAIGAQVHAADARHAQAVLAGQLGRPDAARSATEDAARLRERCPGLRWAGRAGAHLVAAPAATDLSLLVASLTGRERSPPSWRCPSVRSRVMRTVPWAS